MLYFRDKSAVFFSMLADLIVLALYLLFLKDVWANNADMLAEPSRLMNAWIVAGLMTITGVTTTLGAFAVMIDDKNKKITKDFYAAPIKRTAIAGGYVCSAFCVGFIMSIITFLLGEGYILVTGGTLLSVISVLKVLAMVFINTLTSTAMVFLIVTTINSMSTFGNISIVIGTVIGFLTGMYLPIGQLPEGVQTVMKLFPITYSAGLFRQIMMEDALEVSFAGIDQVYRTGFEEEMGCIYRLGDYTVTPELSILILTVSALLLFILSVLNLSRHKK